MYAIRSQFDAMENGVAITKLMQIFSRQAPMMDALLSYFTEQMRRRREGFDGQPPEYTGPEGTVLLHIMTKSIHAYTFKSIFKATIREFSNHPAEPNPIQNNGVGVLSNKLSRLTLATFDDEARCINQSGSLSISF